MNGGACEGLRVLDFSTWMAGPLATMILADNGAEVIKIEPPDGDPARALPAFQTWNRGKKSIVLDLKSDSGRKRALELTGDADVVVTSFRPGVAARLGLDFDHVRRLNGRAVYASITGFGEEGAFSHLKGYEPLVCAKMGRMMMFERIADRDGPGYPAVPCASYSAAMLTVQGVLAALHRRTATDCGQRVGVSLLAALIPYDLILWIGHQLREQGPEAEGQTATMYLQQLMGRRQQLGSEGEASKTYNPREVHRPSFRVPRPNYLTAVTKDGVWLQFANTIDHLCFAQMQALDLLDVYGDERFAKLPAVADETGSEAIWEIILERVRTKTYDEWMAVFDTYENVAVEKIRWPREAIHHRQVRHNGNVIDVPGLDGKPTKQLGPLVRFSECAATAGAPPQLDQHAGAAFASRTPATNGAKDVQGAGPLAGITIVDFSQWIAAPYSTGILANMGARVIRVEVPGGDFSRYSTDGLLSFPMTQGKESIALDLKTPQGQQVARRLIERADMVVHNFRPGVAERLGIDYQTSRQLNPRLIYLNAASYGDSGPDSRRPAFYAIAAANGGNQMRQVGDRHPVPGSESLPIDDLKEEAWRLLKAAEWNADPIAALASATALLLGLHARDRSGRGQELLTSMLCSNMYANSDDLIEYEGRPDMPLVDENLYGLGPNYRLYQAADGWVFLACVQRQEWEAFCVAIGKPELASRWPVDGEDIAEELAAMFAPRPAEDWERVLSEHDVPLVAVEMRDPGRFILEEPMMRDQGHIVEVEAPVYGTYRRHGALQTFSDEELTFGGWEPLGGHTRSVMEELGYSDEEISELIEASVVEAWTPA